MLRGLLCVGKVCHPELGARSIRDRVSLLRGRTDGRYLIRVTPHPASSASVMLRGLLCVGKVCYPELVRPRAPVIIYYASKRRFNVQAGLRGVPMRE